MIDSITLLWHGTESISNGVHYSVLEADLNCFRELHSARDRRNWRYLINLTGQEFPLRTHLELVRILSILNGANLMEAQPIASRSRLQT